MKKVVFSDSLSIPHIGERTFYLYVDLETGHYFYSVSHAQTVPVRIWSVPHTWIVKRVCHRWTKAR